MTEKFNISDEDELIILKYWLKDFYNNFLKIPESLKGKITKITEEQVTKLGGYYQDLGNNEEGKTKEKMENKIKELESKFQKQKEQSFWHLIKKYLKELFAKKIAILIIAVILWIIWIVID